jgi:uncharacterized membrane protein YjfL (UPF0719 family)
MARRIRPAARAITSLNKCQRLRRGGHVTRQGVKWVLLGVLYVLGVYLAAAAGGWRYLWWGVIGLLLFLLSWVILSAVKRGIQRGARWGPAMGCSLFLGLDIAWVAWGLKHTAWWWHGVAGMCVGFVLGLWESAKASRNGKDGSAKADAANAKH